MKPNGAEINIYQYISQQNINLELLICTDILKLNSLHYGYWDESVTDITLADVRVAQYRYSERLMSHIPKDVKSILDVGCGIGDISKALANKGFTVTAISPDGNHGKFFDQLAAKNIDFRPVSFQELDVPKKFDLVLMSESQNYIDMNEGFDQCARYLKSGGYLLVCDFMKKRNTKHFSYIRLVEDDYIASAAKHGLQLQRKVDITDNVLPTMMFAQTQYENYIAPFLNVVNHYVNGTAPFKLAIIKWFLRKEIRRAQTIHHYYSEFFDPPLFREYLCYGTYLFKNNG